jgi:hypothetical protein
VERAEVEVVKTQEPGNDMVGKVLDLVESELVDLYGPDGYQKWGEWAFMIVEGEAVVYLIGSPVGEDAVLNVRCYLVRDVERPDPGLGEYLARLNGDQLFGGFSLDEDSDVCFDYSMLGSAVTPDAIDLAIEVVANAASEYAGEIIARWGGVTSLDKLIRELGEAPEALQDKDTPLN